MSFYKDQTKRMISLLQEGRTINVMSDFFAQLSRIRPLINIAIINAMEPSDVDSSKLILQSITYRDWMKDITLEDIRKHVVFCIWKEHQTIVSSDNYYDESISNDNYHNCHSPDKELNPQQAEDIGVLLETCFYIRQICVLKELVEDNFDDISIIEEDEWDMYHFWLLNSMEKKGMQYLVYENFKLIEPLIRSSET